MGRAEPLKLATAACAVVAVTLGIVVLLLQQDRGRLRARLADVQADLDRVRADVAAAAAAEAPKVPAPISAKPPAPTAGEAAAAAAESPESERRVTALQELLLAKDATIADLEARLQERDARRRNTPDRRGATFAERLEQMRVADPERYAAMQDRFQRMNERMTTALEKQQDMLAGLDTAALTPAEAENHTRLLELLAANRDLTDMINQDPEAEDVPQLRRELFANMRAAGELLGTERNILFRDLANQLGYKDADAQQFTDYLNRVLESTSPGSLFRGMRGDRRGPPSQSGP